MNPRIYTGATSHINVQHGWSIIDSIKTTLPESLRVIFESFDNHSLYRLNHQGAFKYALVQEYYPREYEVLKEAIRMGRLVPSGSMWEPSDMVIPSDESILRNIYYGNDFFLKEYNRGSEDVFLVEGHAFPNHLPSLLSHMNVKALTLFEKEGELSGKTGFSLGSLEGPDGSKVYLAIAKRDEKPLTESLSSREDLSKERISLKVFGPLEGGGVPDDSTLEVIEKDIKRGSDYDTGARVISAKSDEFYHPLLEVETPTFKKTLGSNKLNAGLLTMNASFKKQNRTLEELLLDTERLSASASILGFSYPKEQLEGAWKGLLSHQSYFDLGGDTSSEARRLTKEDLDVSLNKTGGTLITAATYLSHYLDTTQKGAPLVVYNPFERPVKKILKVTVPEGSFKVYDSLNREVPSQLHGSDLYITVEVPAVGLRVYYVRFEKSEEKASSFFMDESTRTYSSNSLQLNFNEEGDLQSFYDKTLEREMLDAPMKLLHGVLDKEDRSITEELLKSLEEVKGEVSFSVKHEGELFLDILVSKKYKDSSVNTIYRLYQNSRELEVNLELDWKEPSSYLALEVPSSIYSEKATYLMEASDEVREMKEEGLSTFSKGGMVLTDGSFSLSLMSLHKSGWAHPRRNVMRLDLLYDPKSLEKKKHHMNFSLKAFKGDQKPKRELEEKRHPLKAFYTEHHPGPLGAKVSFLEVLTEGVSLKAFKHSETTDHLFIRVQETEGRLKSEVKIDFLSRILSMQEVDGAENLIPSKSMLKGNTMTFELKPYEMKAYLIKLQWNDLGETPILSEPMSLMLNRNFYSPEGSNKVTKMIPLELAKEELRSMGVDFKFYPERIESAMAMRGQKISLPEGFNTLHLLAGCLEGDKEVVFEVDGKKESLRVSSFYLSDKEGGLEDPIAFVATHLHAPQGNLIYEKGVIYQYMLRGKRFKFPEDEQVLVFAASASLEHELSPAHYLYEQEGEEHEESTH